MNELVNFTCVITTGSNTHDVTLIINDANQIDRHDGSSGTVGPVMWQLISNGFTVLINATLDNANTTFKCSSGACITSSAQLIVVTSKCLLYIYI